MCFIDARGQFSGSIGTARAYSVGMSKYLSSAATFALLAIGFTEPVHAVIIGNDLIERQYATDAAPDAYGVFVVDFGINEAGTLESFQTFGQQVDDSQGNSSIDGSFQAFVLRPTGGANEYEVVFATDLLTASLSGINTFSLSTPFEVLAGDLVAHFGDGIPLSVGGGTSALYFPTFGGAPDQGDVITLGSGEYANYDSNDRTYSIAAEVGSPSITAQVAVPDGGTTVALLGMAMTAVGLARRKLG